MYLSEIFEYLTHGELAQMNLGGGGADEIGIDPANYPKIITNINLAMVELHKRFPIKQNEIDLQLYSHITDYRLTSAFAETNTASAEPYKYIQDYQLREPFKDDVILIRHVYDEAGDEFPLNDLNNTLSLYTPEHNILQVPFPDNENTLNVIYRAGPVKINHIGFSEPEKQWVNLTDQFLEPLCSYVAHRIFSSLNLGEGNAEANSYYQKFNDACDRIEELGLYVADSNQNTHFDDFGESEWP